MKKQEQEAWERFLTSGAVGDYLDYRASVGFSRKQYIDEGEVTEVESGAAVDGCGDYTGKTFGGTGSSPYSADP